MSCQTNWQMSYLKFASPVLDESTIAGVGDVLRSGQLTSGPWVQRFEQDLSAFCGGRPTRVLTSATAAIEDESGFLRLIDRTLAQPPGA